MNQSEFVAAALTNPVNRIILERLPQLGVADCWLVSGSLFQTVWNVLTKRPPEHGIKDYDIPYFDPDTSWDAEDAVIKRGDVLFAGLPVEIRNQARVHLWYEEKFGTPYPPLTRATDGIDRFMADCSMVGMRIGGAGHEVYAPKGFADIEKLIVRPNRMPNFHPARYEEKAQRWRERWPELTVLPA